MSEPHRIYGWQHGHLSIVRHYGGAIINGKTYVIRYDIDGQPLEEVGTKKREKPKPPTRRDRAAEGRRVASAERGDRLGE